MRDREHDEAERKLLRTGIAATKTKQTRRDVFGRHRLLERELSLSLSLSLPSNFPPIFLSYGLDCLACVGPGRRAREGLSGEAPPRGSDAAAAFIQYVEERARRRTEEGPLWRQLYF